MNRWLEAGFRGDLLALIAGALLPFAFAPLELFFIAPLAMALLFVLWLQVTPRQAAWRGFLFGLGQFGVGVSWVYVAIHDFGFTGVALAVILTLLFVAILALYPALAGYIARRLVADNLSPGWFLLFVAPAAWLVVEWLRGWLFTGFPWLQLGYSQIDSPLHGWAPLFGVLGLSALVAVSAGAVVWLFMARGRAVPWSVPLLLAIWLGGIAFDQVQWVKPYGKPLTVSLIQGNISQEEKWSEAVLHETLERYASMTRPLLGHSQLVVWPENAITVFYHELRGSYFAPLSAAARAAGSDIVVGVPVLADDGRHYYTSMVSLGSHTAFYHKTHLVPFGEYVPLEWLLRGLIRFFDLPMTGFIPGPEQQPLLQVDGVKAATTICYEDAFGAPFAANLRDAKLLINGSNNGWYGDSFAPHQHLQIARMRALETGRPLARATTNGISALVDAKGHILARSPQFVTYTLSGELQPMTGTTPYVRWRDWPLMILLGVVFAGVWWRRKREVR